MRRPPAGDNKRARERPDGARLERGVAQQVVLGREARRRLARARRGRRVAVAVEAHPVRLGARALAQRAQLGGRETVDAQLEERGRRERAAHDFAAHRAVLAQVEDELPVPGERASRVLLLSRFRLGRLPSAWRPSCTDSSCTGHAKGNQHVCGATHLAA